MVADGDTANAKVVGHAGITSTADLSQLHLEPSSHANSVLSVSGRQKGFPCPLAWQSFLEAARPLSGLENVSSLLIATKVTGRCNCGQLVGAFGATGVPIRELPK